MDDYSGDSGEGGGGGAAADADASYELASASGPSATTTRGGWEGGAGGAEAPSLQEYLVEEDDPVDSDSSAEDYYGGFSSVKDLLEPAPAGPAWDWGSISQVDAEAQLESQPAGTFLIRESATKAGTYTVTLVQHDGGIKHIRIKVKDGGYVLRTSDPAARDLDELIAMKTAVGGGGGGSAEVQLTKPLAHPNPKGKIAAAVAKAVADADAAREAAAAPADTRRQSQYVELFPAAARGGGYTELFPSPGSNGDGGEGLGAGGAGDWGEGPLSGALSGTSSFGFGDDDATVSTTGNGASATDLNASAGKEAWGYVELNPGADPNADGSDTTAPSGFATGYVGDEEAELVNAADDSFDYRKSTAPSGGGGSITSDYRLGSNSARSRAGGAGAGAAVDAGADAGTSYQLPSASGPSDDDINGDASSLQRSASAIARVKIDDFPDQIEDWTADHVATFLISINQEYRALKRNIISEKFNGEDLMAATEENGMLKDTVGIPQYHRRMKIHKARDKWIDEHGGGGSSPKQASPSSKAGRGSKQALQDAARGRYQKMMSAFYKNDGKIDANEMEVLSDHRHECPWITDEDHATMLAEIKAEHEFETRKPVPKPKPKQGEVFFIPVVKDKDVTTSLPVLPDPDQVKKVVGFTGIPIEINGAIVVSMPLTKKEELLQKYPDNVVIDGITFVVSPYFKLVYGFECPKETDSKAINQSLLDACKAFGKIAAWCLQLDITTGTTTVAVTTEQAFRQLEREGTDHGGILLNIDLQNAFRCSLNFSGLPNIELQNMPYSIKTKDAVADLLGSRMKTFGIRSVENISNRGLRKVVRIEVNSEEQRNVLLDIGSLSAGGKGTGHGMVHLKVSATTAPSIADGKGDLDGKILVEQITIRSRNFQTDQRLREKLAPKEHRNKLGDMTWSPKDFKKLLDGTYKIKDQRVGNLHRQILRQIVMETTVADVERGCYRIPEASAGMARLLKLTASKSKTKTVELDNKCPATVFYSGKDRTPYRGLAVPVALSTAPRTKVLVVKLDCLEYAHQMTVKDGLNPVVLNMANATIPGGAYLRGAGAQEENLFRRSNYYIELDPGLNGVNKQYPIGGVFAGLNKEQMPYERDAVYTSGVTVFRGTEAEGYPYLPEPYKVSMIATAAYRWDRKVERWEGLDRDNTARAAVVRLKSKLDVILAAAVQNGHDSVVLSALGCGAFGNPPEQVAQIFHASLSNFNGVFKKVVFAIIDDHNSTSAGDGRSNFQVFSKFFRDMPLDNPPVGMRSIDFKKDKVCDHGSHCRSNDRGHMSSYKHPEPCPNLRDCEEFGEVHRLLYTHKCPKGAMCDEWQDKDHFDRFWHPEECKLAETCENTDTQHLRKYLHYPLCANGTECADADNGKCKKRHAQLSCEFGAFCHKFEDKRHWDKFFHPQRQVCEYASTCENKEKCSYAHVCEHGWQCTKKDDPAHQLRYLHIRRAECEAEKSGGICREIHNDDHVDLYSHKGICDIRINCNKGLDCPEKAIKKHFSRYRHKPSHTTFVECQPCATHGTVGTTEFEVDFRENHRHIAESVNTSVFGGGSVAPDPEIVDWAARVRPQHRCRLDIFKSMLVHGNVISATQMKLLKDGHGVKKELAGHPDIQRFAEAAHKQNKVDFQHAVKRFVSFAETVIDIHYEDVTAEDSNYGSNKANARALLSGCGKPFSFPDLEELAQGLAEAAKILAANAKGINYTVDKEMKTDETVFAIMGPHTGYYYGCIILIFKREIMAHPDFSMTCSAGTSHASGKVKEFKWKSVDWPAAGAAPTPKEMEQVQPHRDKRILHYHTQKINAALPGFEDIFAKELAAATPQGAKATRSDVTKRHNWNAVDSHNLFEGHLPAVCPFSTVDKIIFPKHDYKQLTEHELEQLKTWFPKAGQIIVTDTDMPPPEPLNYHKEKNGALQTELLKLSEREALERLDSVMPAGFSFGAAVPMKPCFLPTRIQKGGKAYINMRVHVSRGNGFFVVLHSGRKTPADNKYKVLIYIEPPSHQLSNKGSMYIAVDQDPLNHYAIERSPALGKGMMGHKESMPGFDASCDIGNAGGTSIGYEIHLDAAKKTVSVTHYGVSRAYNSLEVVATGIEHLADVRYVGVMPHSEIANARNVNVNVQDARISPTRLAELTPANIVRIMLRAMYELLDELLCTLNLPFRHSSIRRFT